MSNFIEFQTVKKERLQVCINECCLSCYRPVLFFQAESIWLHSVVQAANGHVILEARAKNTCTPTNTPRHAVVVVVVATGVAAVCG